MQDLLQKISILSTAKDEQIGKNRAVLNSKKLMICNLQDNISTMQNKIAANANLLDELYA
jgi:hypothetical protein